MKHIRKYMPVLFAVMLFSACEEESTVEIDSVSAMGDEFFYGQKVKVWMVVRTDDLPAARYTWSCNGGRITQPQGLDENTWEAPREPGIYTVTCKVDVNGTKKSRSREMYVSSFYFDQLERTPHTFTTNSSSATLVEDKVTGNSYLQTRVSTSTATRGYAQRAYGDPDLRVPVSAQLQVGWIANFPTDFITIGSNTAENTLYYEWTLNRDPDKEDNLFIDNIRFEWYPVGRTSGLPVDGVGNPWNGTVRFQQRNITTNGTTAFNVYVNHPALDFAQKEYKKVSMSIDADYIVHIFVDGEEVLNTPAIRDWRITNGSKDDIYVNQWRINYPSNSSSKPAPQIYIDNAATFNDGTILK